MKIGDKLVPVEDYPDIPAKWKEIEILGEGDGIGFYHVKCLNGEIIHDFNIDNHDVALFLFKVKP